MICTDTNIYVNALSTIKKEKKRKEKKKKNNQLGKKLVKYIFVN